MAGLEVGEAFGVGAEVGVAVVEGFTALEEAVDEEEDD